MPMIALLLSVLNSALAWNGVGGCLDGWKFKDKSELAVRTTSSVLKKQGFQSRHYL